MGMGRECISRGTGYTRFGHDKLEVRVASR